MKILIDAQLPPSLKLMLAEAGHAAVHVADIGLRNAEDADLWNYALREAAVIFTKDEDFAARRLRDGRGPVIVWIRVGNTSRAALMRRLSPLLPTIENLVQCGEGVIEVR